MPALLVVQTIRGAWALSSVPVAAASSRFAQRLSSRLDDGIEAFARLVERLVEAADKAERRQ